jgi:hypothetical protein
MRNKCNNMLMYQPNFGHNFITAVYAQVRSFAMADDLMYEPKNYYWKNAHWFLNQAPPPV